MEMTSLPSNARVNARAGVFIGDFLIFTNYSLET